MEGTEGKRCPRCGEWKPLDAFARRRKTGRASYCRICNREYQRGRPRIITAKRFVQSYKDGKPCTDCARVWPHFALDFDHLPGGNKKANISVLVKRGASKEVLLAEMSKCELVCATCHRFRTWERKMASKKVTLLSKV